MENTGEVVASTAAVPIQDTVEVASGAIGSVVEPLMESAGDALLDEFPAEDLSEEENGYFGFEVGELNEENEGADLSEEERIDSAREELEEIKKDTQEPEDEKDNGYDEQLATLNETIRLLEMQRDALKEQLGESLITFFTKLADYFFAETFMDKPSLVENNSIGQPTEAWKEDARHQLRTIETKIADLKQYRDRLVANN